MTCVRPLSPAVEKIEKPTTSLMSLPLKWKISLDSGRAWIQYVAKVHISTGKGSPSVDSPHMVLKRMEAKIDQSNINI